MLTIFGDGLMITALSKAKQQQVALADLHRLATLSIKLFATTDEPSEIAFWQQLGGIPPMRDPWGNIYHLNAGHQTAEWVSAGPDGRMGTSDDLRLKVPTGRAIPDSLKHFDTPTAASAK